MVNGDTEGAVVAGDTEGAMVTGDTEGLISFSFFFLLSLFVCCLMFFCFFVFAVSSIQRVRGSPARQRVPWSIVFCFVVCCLMFVFK